MSVNHEKVRSEIASHGYIVIAMGRMQMSLDDRKIEKAETSKGIEALEWATTQNKNMKSDFYKKTDLEKDLSSYHGWTMDAKNFNNKNKI